MTLNYDLDLAKSSMKEGSNFDFSIKKIQNPSKLQTTTSLQKIQSPRFTFIDLFAGIGGFHIAGDNLGGKCVFACEIDQHARKTYQTNFRIKTEIFPADVTEVESNKVPDHDILFAGFPCQPFSQAGFKKGFSDIRGTLFFNIAQIISEKRPQAIFLENVRHLYKHANGYTFERIQDVIQNQLGYTLYYKIIHASDYGVPQLRPRLFMVAFRDKKDIPFKWPEPIPLKFTMSDLWEGKCSRKIGFTLRVGGRGSKITDRRNWDSYLVDGEVKRLGSEQGLKMQGFPDNFKFPVSEVQAMKQLGNSVAVPAVQATLQNILDYLNI